MNAKEEADRKKEAKRLAIEKDRQAAKRIIQYVHFYFAVLMVLSLTNYFFTLLFAKIEHGNFGSDYHAYSPLEGFGYLFFSCFITFPLLASYNYVINLNQPAHIAFRILIFFVFLAFSFYLVQPDYEFGDYIGKYRPLKNIIVLFISSVFVELLRDLVIKRGLRKKESSYESLFSNE